jgi:hypothetical protein
MRGNMIEYKTFDMEKITEVFVLHCEKSWNPLERIRSAFCRKINQMKKKETIFIHAGRVGIVVDMTLFTIIRLHYKKITRKTLKILTCEVPSME